VKLARCGVSGVTPGSCFWCKRDATRRHCLSLCLSRLTYYAIVRGRLWLYHTRLPQKEIFCDARSSLGGITLYFNELRWRYGEQHSRLLQPYCNPRVRAALSVAAACFSRSRLTWL